MSFVSRRFVEQAPTESLSVLTASRWHHRFYRRYGKRGLDLTLVLLSAPFVLSFVGFLAILVRVFSRGPAFYWQERVARDGSSFRMLKLRTMVVDADAILEAHLAANPAARVQWDRSQKLIDDPRVTRIGRILRRCSLDELPQLWNVLRGDMALVGPRPMMVEQAPIYPGTAYFRMRPGITGPWQVADRHGSTFADRAGYDASYELSLGLKNDLRLLMRTVGVVLRGTGV
ncbi:sugar transferase [Tropicimonas sediminicola]|uniref:Sugar transferase involved in LPS biosynthesis (Colanic, teichoic acid) n=1 Tax=Tropicimonas sediminicola TaxID=1031541 RepID=A0A239HAR4_9RHOB|nr:sugar transferase [Tropicimonas sediminicola]SNS78225.1 Sugar transferase involved in LPS biosynthesis (colanic, teichoic acid) [Tropicimonas sediminicola]